MNAYIVIADTSNDYFIVHKEMFFLSEKLHFKIDTLNRGFDKAKNLICLSKDNEDNLYAGEYFPRRYPSETLSLEYLDYYLYGSKPTGGTIGLVVAITENKEKAQNILIVVKHYAESAYILNTKLYMGCMH